MEIAKVEVKIKSEGVYGGLSPGVLGEAEVDGAFSWKAVRPSDGFCQK